MSNPLLQLLVLAAIAVFLILRLRGFLAPATASNRRASPRSRCSAAAST